MVRPFIVLLCSFSLCGCPQVMSDDFVIGGQAGAAASGGSGVAGGGAGATGGGGGGAGATGGGGEAGAGGYVEPSCRHVWSRRFAGPSGQTGRSVAVDGGGSVLVTGDMRGSVDFGGGELTSAGEGDIFVVKLGPDGAHLWSQRFGDDEEQTGRSVAVDNAGNVLVTGEFHGSVDFGGGVRNSAGDEDIFVVKLDPDGAHLWSQRFGDDEEQIGRSVAVDSAGNVLVTGEFHGSVDFGGGELTSAGEGDIFVVKLDPNGAHLWSQRFGNWNGQSGRSVAVDDAGNVFVTGEFHGSVDFGGGALASVDQTDVFLVKLDGSGGHSWSSRFGGTGDQSGNGIAVDGIGSPRLTGAFQGTIDFGGGALQSTGWQQDAFLARFTLGGGYMWGQDFGDGEDQQGDAVAVDSSGNSVITGSLRGAASFGGELLIASGSAEDVYFARFAPGGEHLCSRRFGDTEAQSGLGIATRSDGGFVITGRARGTLDFGGGPLGPGGGDSHDVFVARFSP